MALTTLPIVTNEAGQKVSAIPFIPVDANGDYAGGGGGGGGGDASAANQVLTNTAIGATNETSAAADNSTSGLNGLIKRLLARLTIFMAQLPTTLGSKAASASLAITASTEDIARVGIITETAPASDTASSGLNGRMQRMAQNITAVGVLISAMSAKLTAALGRTAAASSFGVVLSTEDKTALDATNTKLDTLHTDLQAGTVATTTAGTTATAGVPMQGMTGGVPMPAVNPCDVVAFTPTIDTSIYAAGEVLFDSTQVTIFRANDQRALLTSVSVTDKSDQKPALKLFFFSANVSLGTINAAPSISDANAVNFIGSVTIAAADYDDLGGVSVACQKNIGLLLEAVSGAATIYVAGLLTAGTPTFAASDIVIRLGVVQS